MQKLIAGLMAATIAAVWAPHLAQAQPARAKAEARLASPVTEPKKVVFDARVWSCAADLCVADGGGYDQPVKRECARATKALGPVVSYRRGDRNLDEAELADCNKARSR